MILMTLLVIKHFVCDFLLQGPYQYKNKGIYGHPGGILHASIAVIGSLLALMWFAPLSSLILLLTAEWLIHYHEDWFKTNFNAKMGWGPLTHDEFWWLLGFDQLVHYLTYCWMIWFLQK